MRTLVLDPGSVGLGEFFERRRRLGLDKKDEVWEGVLHLVPAASGEHAFIGKQLIVLLDGPAGAAGLYTTLEFNVGDSLHDFRVPDAGLHRELPRGVWHSTAALVVDVVSPGDETWEKLPFYAQHHVDELLIVDPTQRAVHWLALEGGEYRPIDHSRLIDLGAEDLAKAIDWP